MFCSINFISFTFIGETVTSSTPLSTRVSKPDGVQTPVSRKLFGGETDVKPASGSFKFGADTECNILLLTLN